MNHTVKSTLLSLAVSLAPVAAFADTAKEVVTKAVTEVFVDGNIDAIDAYFSTDYIQRNSGIPSGTAVIKDLFGHMPENFKYEVGMIIAEGDMVAVHARITGFGPKPLIGVDIFRVQDGLIVEHWDVLQEEVTETASGMPMFDPMQ